MRRLITLVSAVSLFTLCGNAAWHWYGVNGVGDFEVPTNWGEGTVPGEGDFLVVKNYSAADWEVRFNSNITNLKAELASSTVEYDTLFKLNGYTWKFTEDIHIIDGNGGTLIFTNGVIETPAFTFNAREHISSSVTIVSSKTNLVLELKDVDCETATAGFASTRATFEGGSLTVTNTMSIGYPAYGVGTVILDQGVQCNASNIFMVGESIGATGELINIDGQFEQRGADGTFFVGKYGYGSMVIQGGSTYIDQTPSFGNSSTGVGMLTVSGGLNTFGKVGGKLLVAGEYGKGMVWAEGGINYANGLSFGHSAGGYGEMTLTNGVWNILSYSWIGYFGTGVIHQTGGTLNSGGTFCIGRGNGVGIVTVAGGTLTVNGELRLGGNAGSIGQLTLTGDGVLKTGWIGEYNAGANSEFVCDGGTLQAGTSGRFIRSVDDLWLTANGMVLDTLGLNVSIESALQDAAGEAGSFTKQGLGTVTLAADRTATGPVSVLQGTLVSSNNLAVTAAGTLSKIDGTLTLTTDKRLVMSSGAAIAGVGTVSRVTLQDNSLFARDKSDGATTPLLISDGIADDHLTIALTGYTLNDLKTALPLISSPTAFVDLAKVTVTLDGESQPFLTVKYDEVGGQQVLSVKYSAGTVIVIM